MTPMLVVAVLLAAILHATWNSLAHSTSDRLVGLATIGMVESLGGLVIIAIVGLPEPSAWSFIVGSAALHVAYDLFLATSYRLGDFSQMYPLARGTSPWVVTAISVLVLGHTLPVGELLGVVAISLGLIALVFVGGRPTRADLPAVGAAMTTGMMIAGYTVIDGVGVHHSDVWSYIGWMFFLQGPPLAVILGTQRRGTARASVRATASLAVPGGLISLAAYGIVLWAQTRGPLAPIAALRETSIIFGAIIGTVFLGEKLGQRRSLAAAVVFAGAALVSFT